MSFSIVSITNSIKISNIISIGSISIFSIISSDILQVGQAAAGRIVICRWSMGMDFWFNIMYTQTF